MLDGVLSRDEHKPTSDAAPPALPGPRLLLMLIAAMTAVWIAAAVLFPNVVGDLGPGF